MSFKSSVNTVLVAVLVLSLTPFLSERAYAQSLNGVRGKRVAQEAQSQAVDLGLPSGLKWAAGNVGAKNPWDYGMYFAWGGVDGQRNDSQVRECWSFDMNHYINSRCSQLSSDVSPEYDAAHVNLGGKWRMPTYKEFEELALNCNWSWTEDYKGTGVAGAVITSKSNGNSIFFPASGKICGKELCLERLYGLYWTSSCFKSSLAFQFCFRLCMSGIGVRAHTIVQHLSQQEGVWVSHDFRYYGKPVRGVCE